jgi:hypothetical protein
MEEFAFAEPAKHLANCWEILIRRGESFCRTLQCRAKRLLWPPLRSHLMSARSSERPPPRT